MLLLVATSALLATLGCDPFSGGSSNGGSSGTSGSGGTGGCDWTPKPSFALRVLASAGGPVPPDTTVDVHWSAGDEPSFHLDQPETWATLETGNVVCDLDRTQPPPKDLMALTCSLWTSGATEVKVSAADYVPKDRTFTPDPSTDCNPDPTPIEIEIDAKPQ